MYIDVVIPDFERKFTHFDEEFRRLARSLDKEYKKISYVNHYRFLFYDLSAQIPQVSPHISQPFSIPPRVRKEALRPIIPEASAAA